MSEHFRNTMWTYIVLSEYIKLVNSSITKLFRVSANKDYLTVEVLAKPSASQGLNLCLGGFRNNLFHDMIRRLTCPSELEPAKPDLERIFQAIRCSRFRDLNSSILVVRDSTN